MAMQEQEVLKKKNLFAAKQNIPAVVDALEIKAGAALKAGALVTSTGELCGADSEVYAVLAEDVDAKESAKSAPVYLTGEFNGAELSAAAGVEISALKVAARKVGIFIKENI